MLLLHFVIYYNTVGRCQHCLSDTPTFSCMKIEKLYTLILEVLIFKNSIIISLITEKQ